jgi:hypothetical protein
VNTGGEHLSEHTDRRTENYFLGTPITLFNIVFYGDYYQGRRPIKQNGPRGARPDAKRKKDKFPLGILDREIRGVCSDHNRDREPVERKIIAKRDIITRTDRFLHEHQR